MGWLLSRLGECQVIGLTVKQKPIRVYRLWCPRHARQPQGLNGTVIGLKQRRERRRGVQASISSWRRYSAIPLSRFAARTLRSGSSTHITHRHSSVNLHSKMRCIYLLIMARSFLSLSASCQELPSLSKVYRDFRATFSICFISSYILSTFIMLSYLPVRE